jgi:His/Glu/Gln/Arg/opine family amino acid ABC transporter permease subunit
MERPWLHILWLGLEITIKLSLATIGLSIVVAALLAIASISEWRLVRWSARFVVDLLRSIPALALLIFVYYGLGKYVASWHIDPFWMAVFALTLGEASFLSEIFRAGLEAVPRTQWEAASSLGFRRTSTLARVIAPQALLPSIPGLVNMSIFTFKDSSLASVISVPEITQTANQLVSETVKPLQVYLLLAGFYLAVILPFTFAAGLAEKAVVRYYGLRVDKASIARN